MSHYQVVQRTDGSWSVIRSDSMRASAVFNSEKKAVATARELLGQAGGTISVIGEHRRTIKLKATSSQIKQRTKTKTINRLSETSLGQRVGSRIERARLMRGHSLRSLAEALNGQYSHTSLQKYEKGEISVDTEVLAVLANALDIRPDYFMKSDQLKLEMVEYRKLSKLPKKEQKKIEEEAFEFFERYLEIESILSITADELPMYDLSGKTGEELDDAVEKAALDLRKKWELGLNPIPNVHAMLEQQGVKVKLLNPRPGFDGFSAVARVGQRPVPAVALSRESENNKVRQRFTALHELGHLILKFSAHLTAAEKEKACHRFAGAVLAPRSVFIDAFGRNRVKISVPELKAIKADWGISCAAIMKRAHNLKLITDGRYKSFNIMANKWGWRKEEPGYWSGDEESNRFDHLVFRALAEEVITVSKACGLLHLTNAELAEIFELVG